MAASPQLESVLAAFQSLAHDPSKVLHVSTLAARRAPLFVSAGVEPLFGYAPAEWLADPGLFWSLLHPDDLPRVEAALTGWDHAGTLELRYRLRTRDGRTIHCVETTGASLDAPGGPQQQGLIADETAVRLLLDALDAVQAASEPGRALVPFCDALASLLGLDTAGFADARGHVSRAHLSDAPARPSQPHAPLGRAFEALVEAACAGGDLVVDHSPGGWAFAVRVPGHDGRSLGALWGWRGSPPSIGARERAIVAGLARHAAVALQRAELVAELARMSADRQRLAESVVMAHEDERRRIASELHDGAGQTLMAAVIQLDLARARVEAPAARDALDRARTQVERTLEDLRGLAHALRPATLDRLGLADALREMAGALSGATLQVQVQVPDGEVRLEPEVATAIFRIAQASLANVARHARAQRALLRLEVGPAAVEMVVEDDGQGLQKAPSVGGIGLLAMKERAHAVGGALELESRVGGGTRVRVTIPLS